MMSMQKYFSSKILRDGISTSGRIDSHIFQPVTKSMSKLVKENDLDDFFKAASIEEQKELFQKISSGLEDAVLLVNG